MTGTNTRCSSYGEYSYSKMTTKWQEPTPGVHPREMSVLQRVYSYSKMTGKQQEPTPGVCLREMSKQPSQVNYLSLLFGHFFVHSCLVLCCLIIAFPPIHLLISLLLVICFKLAITRIPNNLNFFRFPLKVQIIGR